MTNPKFKNISIEAYRPGKSNGGIIKNTIKLSANESALGVSPKVKKIISNKKINFYRYPDGNSTKLRKEISKKFKCNINKIICGAGSDEITIQGVKKLSGTSFQIPADRIEAGTYLAAAAVTKGDIKIEGINPNRLMNVIDKLIHTGAKVDYDENSISFSMTNDIPNPVDITTAPFPEFPTDMQAQFSVINAISSGTANIYETIFENRFMHILELNRMGCDISVNGNHAIIKGVKSIYGAEVMATDLRASASLILAGLCAKGETVVDRIYHIDRGYERIEEKLNYLGANIVRLPS